ncbi:hypothetical protein CBM2589_B200129 [Cupriavidus taiwanensis]|uniref:Uncharacterized protein n=1 Tax=Cupriavidus taiwanensis TaxID=164546 RepID=A0A375BM49_9BURK|nr:hypothetical protein CBM2589_B200129 [Cupriavidus taiwanensis]
MGDEEGAEVRGADGRVVAGAVFPQGVKAAARCGSLPSPACGRGAGVRAGVSTGGMLEKTEGFAQCGTSLDHPTPRPSPHEGRGRTAQDIPRRGFSPLSRLRERGGGEGQRFNGRHAGKNRRLRLMWCLARPPLTPALSP